MRFRAWSSIRCLFIENRELLDDRYPTRNPAVEWDRFVAAVANAVTGHFESGGKSFGGSTLATQIEKFRHSPEGRTGGIEDKLRQITTASVRAYQDGPLTTAARQRIVVEYINSTPLSARAGFGEVIGLGDGLWAWYGTDLDEATGCSRGRTNGGRAPAGGDDLQAGAQPAARAAAALALSAAGSRRSEQLSNLYLRLMADAGVISVDLRDLATATPLQFREDPPPPRRFRSSTARRPT